MRPCRTTLASVLAAVAVAGPLAASPAAAVTWKMSVENPDGNYHTENAKAFAADVAKATGGALEIDVHPGAELLKRPELKRGVQSGVVQIGDITMSVLGNQDPLFELDSIPLLATSFEEARALWQASRAAIEARLADDGLMLLYAVPWPPQGIYSRAPIESKESLAGVRFRTYNAMTSKLASMLGASPVTVNPGEIPQAFSAGLITAMITSAATGVDYQAWDFVSHYYDVKASFPKQVALLNRSAFEDLPKDAQAALVAAGNRAEERGWQQAADLTAQFNKTLADHGMTVAAAPASLDPAFAEIGAALLDEWLARAGATGRQIVDAYRK